MEHEIPHEAGLEIPHEAGLEIPREAGHEIRFEPSGRRIRVADGTTLLEAARSAGLPVASACGADGVCARCGMRILEGGARIEPEGAGEEELKRRNQIEPELRLSCRVRVDSDLAVTASYW